MSANDPKRTWEKRESANWLWYATTNSLRTLYTRMLQTAHAFFWVSKRLD